MFITARVHPGETPSSYVCQGAYTHSHYQWYYSTPLCIRVGLIDYLVSDTPGATKLRKNIVFKISKYILCSCMVFVTHAMLPVIVPMLNPDGVYLGNYRCSLMGFDLNRHWVNPSSWAHPSLFATKQVILEYDRDPVRTYTVYMYTHMHAQSLLSFIFIFSM